MTYSPRTDVTVFRSKAGNYIVKRKGEGLTKQEKAHGYRYARDKNVAFLRKIYSEKPEAKVTMRKSPSKQLTKWEVSGESWFQSRKTGKLSRYEGSTHRGTVWNVLNSIGWVTASADTDIFTSQWLKLTERQKILFTELFIDVDWNAFFTELIDSDGLSSKKSNRHETVDLDRQEQGVALVQEMFDAVRR